MPPVLQAGVSAGIHVHMARLQHRHAQPHACQLLVCHTLYLGRRLFMYNLHLGLAAGTHIFVGLFNCTHQNRQTDGRTKAVHVGWRKQLKQRYNAKHALVLKAANCATSMYITCN
jgi:hypothetical protein